MREAKRETLLQILQDYPDELCPLVERLILRESDRTGHGQAVRRLLASDGKVAVQLLKKLFTNYRMILVDIVNEAIRKIIADRRKDKENQSAGRAKSLVPILLTRKPATRAESCSWIS
jgi:hypothetical protein